MKKQPRLNIRMDKAKKLDSWKNYFQKNFSVFLKIISDIEKLSGVRNFPISEIPVFIKETRDRKSKEPGAWFSWTALKSYITFEIPSATEFTEGHFSLGILTHEFFHLILRKNRKLFSLIGKISRKHSKILEKVSKRRIKNRMLLEELLVSSFIPEGYFGKKYLNFEISEPSTKKKDLVYWRRLVAWKMRNLAKRYVAEKRGIDEKYLGKIISVVQKETNKNPLRK